jgi:membrane fusion protein (multidrug efflux system)
MAYIPDINGAKVFVSKGGTAMSVTVKAGIRTEDAIQILEGINEGDTVLTTGILQLKPKTPVNVNIVNKAE